MTLSSVASSPLPAAALTASPTLKRLGTLTPDPALLQRALEPDFELQCFEHGAILPQALADFLTTHGYEMLEYETHGMLFAGDCGVSLHTDDYLSALWVLGGQIDADQQSHQLLCGDQSALLATGEVYLFDATQRHGVIASEHGRWVVFSVYLQPSVMARD